MKRLVSSILLGIVLCGQTIHVMPRHPEPTTDSDSGDSTDSTSTDGDGCTTGDGGEF